MKIEDVNFRQIDNWCFSKLDNEYACSGIYVMEFQNGMRYLGKTKSFPARLRQHFKAFSYDLDWHSRAAQYVSQYKLPKIDIVLAYTRHDIYYNYMKKEYPKWKILTEKRREFLDNSKDFQEYAQRSITFTMVWQNTYYKMACDFFHNVKLWLWKVPEDRITEAENYCLNQIRQLGKKDSYYNTAYPRIKKEGDC